MKTGSSTLVGVQFPFELRDAINSFAKNTDKSPSWHIRQACILYLAANGMNVSNLDNPEGRGVRSDLRKTTRNTDEKEKRIKQVLTTDNPTRANNLRRPSI